MSKKEETKKVKIEELKKKCDEYLNGWKRAQADYQNLKREKEKEKEEWIRFANAGLVMELLPVYDNLKLAIEHIPAEQNKMDWVVGMTHIKNQFTTFLNNLGIEEIVAGEGDKFDLEVHEAVENHKNTEITKTQKSQKHRNHSPRFGPSRRKAGEAGKNTELLNGDSEGGRDSGNHNDGVSQMVKKQIKAGYRMKGKVLVPAKVVVG